MGFVLQGLGWKYSNKVIRREHNVPKHYNRNWTSYTHLAHTHTHKPLLHTHAQLHTHTREVLASWCIIIINCNYKKGWRSLFCFGSGKFSLSRSIWEIFLLQPFPFTGSLQKRSTICSACVLWISWTLGLSCAHPLCLCLPKIIQVDLETVAH